MPLFSAKFSFAFSVFNDSSYCYKLKFWLEFNLSFQKRALDQTWHAFSDKLEYQWNGLEKQLSSASNFSFLANELHWFYVKTVLKPLQLDSNTQPLSSQMNIQPSWPTKECGFTMKRVCNMMRTYSQSVKGVRFVEIVEKTYVYSSLKRVRNKHLFQL